MNMTTSESETPTELLPYAEQIREIERLGNLFVQHKIPTNLLDVGATVAFDAMRTRGELKEAYDYLVNHMKGVASEHGLS